MANERLKAKLAALDALQPAPDDAATLAALAIGLADANPSVVAKAATLAAESYAIDLAPAVARAFERVMATSTADPGCVAKQAVAKALKELGHRDPAPFLSALSYVQMEPVWGGKVDTAGPLRSTCAQALVACDIDPTTLLRALVDRFGDGDKWVRVDVARAIAQLDRPESELLLRLKASSGDAEAEVIGQCFVCLIDLAPGTSIPFVARYLDAESDDVRFEAVTALAQAKSFEAFHAIRAFFENAIAPDIRIATIAALAASTHPEAADFLIEIVRARPPVLGAAAIEALAASRFRNDVRRRLAEAIAETDSDRLERAFEEHFGG